MKTLPNKKPLTDDERAEILSLKNELLDHMATYKDFKNFVKISADGVTVADALLNSDYKTFKKFTLKYTRHTAEKMRGIDSLSTYKRVSNICNFLRKNKGGICAKCYAEKSILLYKAALIPALIYNTLLLKYIDIDAAQIPYINNKYFRFESFSDLQSAKHFKNLLTICKKNKNTIFTLWTKAGYILEKMKKAEGIEKLPNNLNIIISEFYINKKTDPEYLKNLQGVLNTKNALKSFSVFDNEKARNDSNMFLCRNSCANCLKCYKKSKNILYIAEKLH